MVCIRASCQWQGGEVCLQPLSYLLTLYILLPPTNSCFWSRCEHYKIFLRTWDFIACIATHTHVATLEVLVRELHKKTYFRAVVLFVPNPLNVDFKFIFNFLNVSISSLSVNLHRISFHRHWNCNMGNGLVLVMWLEIQDTTEFVWLWVWSKCVLQCSESFYCWVTWILFVLYNNVNRGPIFIVLLQ